VSGVGTDKGVPVHLRRVVTDLAVLDLGGPEGTMRLVSTHPGVTVEQVQDATGFPLHTEGAGETRLPTDEELRLIREVLDPKGLRHKEVPAA
jgi:acyl CoA:acetate/3-ketoacid CoA transferase beta subunit